MPANSRFTINRRLLAASFGAPEDSDAEFNLRRFGATPAEQISSIVTHAETGDALNAPPDTELHVIQATATAVILAIREHETFTAAGEDRHDAGFPIQRQLASWHIDTDLFIGREASTFGDLHRTLEEICGVANDLLPSLRALQAGERHLASLKAEPLRLLTYNNRGRLTCSHTSADALIEGDAEVAESLWPLLIATLEHGEASEDWDGERQRALQLRAGGAQHLARQLHSLRVAFVHLNTSTQQALPDPDGGYERYDA
jgi:hypothetical protein